MLKQYQEAIETSNIVSKTDVKGIITFVNDEFCNISGYTKDELLGKNHNIVRHPSIPTKKFEKLWKTIRNKKTYKATVKNQAKDGTTFYVNTTVIPILDEYNEIKEFIAIRYDVTKEMIYKQNLEQKDKELEELNKTLEKRVEDKTKELKKLNETLESRIKKEIAKNEAKQKIMFWQSRLASLGEMIANIAHQWRQPLTELNLTLFTLKKSLDNADKDEIDKLYNSSKLLIQNMSVTIENFTNFFKPDKKKYYFNLTDSIKESINILDKTIKKENIYIKTEFENVKVLGISNELTQVIINLIQNSKDAFNKTNAKEKMININILKNDNFVIIKFKDNAGGIYKKDIDKIFEPYFTTKHTSAGTGLGLFMSKMICEKSLNASINVESLDSFTTFTITIPLSKIDNYEK